MSFASSYPMAALGSIKCRGRGLRCTGFTMVELVLSLAVIVIIASTMTGAGAALFDFFSRPSIDVGGDQYFAAPSEEAIEDSLLLFEELDNLLVTATAVYVFGGFTADTGAPSPPMPLDESLMAGTDLGLSTRNALTSHIADSRELLTAASGTLTPFIEGSADPADFSIVIVGPGGVAEGVVQVRRTTATVAGVGDVVLYDTRLDSTSIVSPLTYRFYRPVAEDAMGMNVGARHYWFRNDVTWDRVEKPGSLVIFPDPLNLPGRRGDEETGNYSRFTYWIPTFG